MSNAEKRQLVRRDPHGALRQEGRKPRPVPQNSDKKVVSYRP